MNSLNKSFSLVFFFSSFRNYILHSILNYIFIFRWFRLVFTKFIVFVVPSANWISGLFHFALFVPQQKHFLLFVYHSMLAVTFNRSHRICVLNTCIHDVVNVSEGENTFSHIRRLTKSNKH